MEQRDQVWLCFFRGLNVFGRNVVLMSDLKRLLSDSFVGLPLRFLDYSDGTGNIALLATGVTEEDIRGALLRAIPKPCAIIKPEVVEEARRAFSSWSKPEKPPGFRWTPGIALLCDDHDDHVAAGDLTEPDVGIFKRLTPTT